MCGRQGRQDKIVSRPKLFRLEVEVDLRAILHSLQHHFWWIKNVRTKMFRGRLGGPLTVLHPESVTTTPLSTIWNNAFFTAAPFSFFPFLLFPFPFSFFLFHFPFPFFLFPFFCPFFFLFLSPCHFFCPQTAVEIIWNHLSSLFSYWIHFFHSVSISPLFDGCCQKNCHLFVLFFSTFLRLEYVYEEPGFSFLIDSWLFLPCFWSETKNVWYILFLQTDNRKHGASLFSILRLFR